MQTLIVRCVHLSSVLVLSAFAGVGCGSDPRSDDDDGGEAGREASEDGGRAATGGTSATQPVPDRCAECSSAAECSTNFCNRIASSDLATLIGAPQPVRGVCSEPADTGTCGCGIGWISNGSLCIGTGCPGEPVELCDHLSGQEFVSGGSGGSGGSSSSACSSSTTDACEQCIEGSCCAELLSCAGNAACVGLIDCASTCSTDTCVNNCVTSYPDGTGDLVELFDCMDARCPVCG